MATAIGDLVVRLNTDDRRFRSGMGGAMRSLGMFTSAGAAAGAAAAFVTRGINTAISAFRRFGAAGMEFNSAMRQSLAIMGDLSAETQQKMRDTAFAVAKATGQSATDMAQSYYYLASAGLDANQAMAALPAVAKFAAAGAFDMATATSLAADAQSALGLVSKDAQVNLANLTRVTDVLIRANTLANASTEQFSQSLTTKSAAAIRALGKDMEEGVAVLAAFADQGVKGEEAGTQFAIVLRDLQTKAIQNAAAFKAAGVSVFDGAGEMRNMADVMADVEKSLFGLSDQAKKTKLLEMGFSDKSLGSIMTLLGTSEKIRQYERQLREAGGYTEEVANKQLGAFSKGYNAFKTALTQMSADVMEWSGPTLGTMFTGLANLVSAFKYASKTIASAFSESFAGMIEVSQYVFDNLGSTFQPFADSAEGAFQTVVQNLDVMLGSVEGWKAGSVNAFYQTMYAFEAIWEQAKNYFLTTWEGLGGWWSTFWLDMQKMMVANLMPGMAKIGIEMQKLLTKVTGGQWLLTPEEENTAINSAQQSAMADLSLKRKEIEAATNTKLEDLRKRHEEAMAGIGAKSIEQSELWAKQQAGLPTLSSQVADEWKEFSSPKGGSSATPGGMPGDIESASVAGVKFAKAAERGSAEAYSQTINSGKQAEKTARAHLAVSKDMAEDIAAIRGNFRAESMVSIPV